MNVHALCNVVHFCTSWATACFTRRQCCGLDDQGIIHQFQAGGKFSLIFKASRKSAQPPIQSVLWIKWLVQEANPLSLSSVRGRMFGAVSAVPPHPPFTHTVCCLIKHGDSFTLSEVFSCYSVQLHTAQTVV
jgi:hypothetical protein